MFNECGDACTLTNHQLISSTEMDTSLAQREFSRRRRTHIPTSEWLLKPSYSLSSYTFWQFHSGITNYEEQIWYAYQNYYNPDANVKRYLRELKGINND